MSDVVDCRGGFADLDRECRAWEGVDCRGGFAELGRKCRVC